MPGVGCTCRILLPANAAVREVESPICRSKIRAKQMAAVIMCRRLYQAKSLNDYLLPVVEVRKREKHRYVNVFTAQNSLSQRTVLLNPLERVSSL